MFEQRTLALQFAPLQGSIGAQALRLPQIDFRLAQGVAGQAIKAMEEVAESTLPAGFGYEWSGISRQEKEAAGQAPVVFALALLFVFLFLAALYESWSIPFAVMLVVPLGLLGAVLAVMVRGLPDDVFFKVG